MMTYYPDLGTEGYMDHGPHVRAVGYLAANHPYPTGPVPLEFLAVLREHVAEPWQPVRARGGHECEFCPRREAGVLGVWGADNLWVPATAYWERRGWSVRRRPALVYVAPSLIVHYIEAHAYQPPAEFIRALLHCPPQGSPRFLELMRQFPAWWEDMKGPSVEELFETAAERSASSPGDSGGG